MDRESDVVGYGVVIGSRSNCPMEGKWLENADSFPSGSASTTPDVALPDIRPSRAEGEDAPDRQLIQS